MARGSERGLSLGRAERLAGGLPVAVRLRVGIELLRSVAGEPHAPTASRGPGSRLCFDRVAIDASEGIRANGAGDASGALLLLWEILAGRPLEGDHEERQ